MTNDRDTLVGLFLDQVLRSRDKEAILEKQGQVWVSFGWNEWNARSRAVAAALLAMGIKRGEHCGIFSYSRRQWFEADIGILMAGGRTVTLYHNINQETVDYILGDCKARVMFAEGPLQLQALVGKDKKLPASLEKVIYFTSSQKPLPRPGSPSPEDVTLEQVVPEDQRERLISFEDFIAQGKSELARNSDMVEASIEKASPDEVAKIIYTSGTTGHPKGAMLTNRNLCSVLATVEEDLEISRNDTSLLFLPLAHVYAQLTYHAALKIGFTTAFAESMLTAIDDAKAVRPHFFATVPRLFEKIHTAVQAKMDEAGGAKKRIFYWATRVGSQVTVATKKKQKKGLWLGAQHKLANKLVFSKLKESLGGNVRFMICGGAPLPKHLNEFFNAAGLVILEGYGMTENASLSHYNRKSNIKMGTVGLPLVGSETRIAQDGEILLRGPNIMDGYLNKPKDTAEVLDDEGWLHTGDIGFVDDEGFLSITDRKKEIIITAAGKNIPPAPIEQLLGQIRFVSQALVFGDRRKFLVALLTLDMPYVNMWANEVGLSWRDDEELADEPKLRAAVRSEIEEVNKRLDPFSTIKNFALVPREFSIQEGEVTPSLKLRRKVIEQRYHDLIEGLYPSETRSKKK